MVVSGLSLLLEDFCCGWRAFVVFVELSSSLSAERVTVLGRCIGPLVVQVQMRLLSTGELPVCLLRG